MANPGDLEATYEAWTSAVVGSEAERLAMDALLLQAAVQTRRVISKVLGTRRTRNRATEVEDACGTAMLNLYRMMLRWRAATAGDRPRALGPYISQIARNVVHDLLREQSPWWFTTAGKVLWKLRHTDGLVLWDDAECRLCALRETAARPVQGDAARLEAACEQVRGERDWMVAPLGELLAALLYAANEPVVFEALVDMVVLCTAAEQSVRSLEEEVAPGLSLGELLAAAAGDPERDTADAEELRWVWAEMSELPRGQRQVCGLNLEAAVGTRLEVFALRGVADEASYELLIRPLLVRHLPGYPPLADPEIARLLRTHAKKISNLRISSQRRLARRFLQRGKRQGRFGRHSTSWGEGVQT